MTTRERNLAVAVSAVLGVAVIGFLGYSFVLSPLLEKDKQIKQKTDEIRQVQNDIDDILAAKRKYEAQRQQSLPADPAQGVGVAREEYGRLLEGLCRRADLTGLKIIVAEPDNKSVPMLAAKKPAYTKLAWDVSAKGDLYHLVDFLRLFYSQPLLHTVKSMTVQRPADNRSRTTRELDVNVKVEALVLDNAPARPNLLPINREIALLSGSAAYTGFNFAVVQNGRGAPVPPPGVLADAQRDYLAIAGKNVFFGPPPRTPTRPDKGPEDDISQFIVLTSIVGDNDGKIEAAFRDALHNYDYTVTQSAKGAIAVKGEWEVNGKKKNIFGYDDKKPSPLLFYGSSEDGNYRAWRVRRVTPSEVILEKADKSEDGEKAKPSGLAFLGGAAGAIVDVPEGKVYSVGVGSCLETEDDEDKKLLHPLATKLLRREAFRAIYAAAPSPEASPVTGLADDRRR
jgi:hypothetical protein